MNVHRYTRRQALQGAGVALAGFAVLGPRVALAADSGTELDEARAATMTALVAALATGPAAGVDPVAYTADFAAFYATSEPPFRGLADHALDRLAVLSRVDAATGLATLEEMTFDPARQLDVADGLTLAGLTFDSEQRGGAGYFLATGVTP